MFRSRVSECVYNALASDFILEGKPVENLSVEEKQDGDKFVVNYHERLEEGQRTVLVLNNVSPYKIKMTFENGPEVGIYGWPGDMTVLRYNNRKIGIKNSDVAGLTYAISHAFLA